MGEEEIKVTDRRMFTEDGELREEYRFLEEGTTSGDRGDPTPAKERREAPSRTSESRGPAPSPASRETLGAPEEGSPQGTPFGDVPPGALTPTFLDLVTLLAEPVPVYLGDARLPDGGSAENLDMARLHIDLLAVLQQKTKGNLGPEETAVLQDLLYRLRLRYVEKRG